MLSSCQVVAAFMVVILVNEAPGGFRLLCRAAIVVRLPSGAVRTAAF